jgi:hypothetical protein
VDLSWILFSLIFAQFLDGFGDHEVTMGWASLISLAFHGHRRTDSAAPWCIRVILALHGLESGLAGLWKFIRHQIGSREGAKTRRVAPSSAGCLDSSSLFRAFAPSREFSFITLMCDRRSLGAQGVRQAGGGGLGVDPVGGIRSGCVRPRYDKEGIPRRIMEVHQTSDWFTRRREDVKGCVIIR